MAAVIAREAVKGLSQTVARNESERREAGGRGQRAEKREARHESPNVHGARMLGTETCVTGGDLSGSRTGARHGVMAVEPADRGKTEAAGTGEESEWLIVAMPSAKEHRAKRPVKAENSEGAAVEKG